MYCEEMESKYVRLAWKLGLPPSTLAHLSSTSSNFQKYVPIGPFEQLEDYHSQVTTL
jgi:hypothetical protein